MPPDSSPPMRMSCSSMRSQTYLKPMPCSCNLRPCLAAMRSSILVVLKARVTSPGQPLRSSSHFSRMAKILCASTTLPCSSTAPMRSASPSVTNPASQRSATTRSCVAAMCGRIGSGLMPGKAGLISLPHSTNGMPARAKMPAMYALPRAVHGVDEELVAGRFDCGRSTNRVDGGDVGRS